MVEDQFKEFRETMVSRIGPIIMFLIIGLLYLYGTLSSIISDYQLSYICYLTGLLLSFLQLGLIRRKKRYG